MPQDSTPNYWLFQANPKVFRLKEALRAESFHTATIKSHQHKIQKGDKIILWQTGKNAGCYALATAISEVGDLPISDAQKAFYQVELEPAKNVQLKIDYNLWNKPITKELLPTQPPFDEFYAGIPGTNFKATFEQYKALCELIEQLDLLQEPAAEYLPRQPISHPLNLILYGPPGTGKTFQTVNYALSIIENRSLAELKLETRESLRDRFEKYQAEGRIAFVTFHQSFSYEDFVEGIKPKVEDQQVIYEVEAGIFKKIAQTAADHYKEELQSNALISKQKKFVLIIDEINRGNVPSIFGELITLLESDKRTGKREALQAILPYSKALFSVPPNLHLIATMNTTDRSAEALDIALRRRFNFVEMSPQPEQIAQIAKQPVAAGVDLAKLLTAINQRIEVLLDKDFCIGHSYFLHIETLADLKNLFSKKIIPLLQEYFFNDYGKIGLVLGEDFLIKKHYGDVTVFAKFEHEFAHDLAEKSMYHLRNMEELTETAFVRIYEAN